MSRPKAGVCCCCGCTWNSPCPNGCAWSDGKRNHCTACLCADCGRRFTKPAEFKYSDEGFRVCRSRTLCLEHQKQMRQVFRLPAVEPIADQPKLPGAIAKPIPAKELVKDRLHGFQFRQAARNARRKKGRLPVRPTAEQLPLEVKHVL